MAEYTVKVFGLTEFQAALKRNPALILLEINKFLIRAIAAYNSGILNNPWRLKTGGGGAPVYTGNLRDTHQKTISKFQASIRPTAPYAAFVHDGTRFMKARPWLDFVKDSKDKEVKVLEENMLDTIVKDLAK